MRLQFTLRIRPGAKVDFDSQELERQITRLISDWYTDLAAALKAAFGETRGRRYLREYANAFPAGYREDYDVRDAADDVASIEQLSVERNLITRFYRLPEDPSERLRLKIFHLGETLPLSDIIPRLENMGLRVVGEHPYRIRRGSGPLISIHDFVLSYDAAGSSVQTALTALEGLSDVTVVTACKKA